MYRENTRWRWWTRPWVRDAGEDASLAASLPQELALSKEGGDGHEQNLHIDDGPRGNRSTRRRRLRDVRRCRHTRRGHAVWRGEGAHPYRGRRDARGSSTRRPAGGG